MKYLDLFSGIGGFHLGLAQAGFQFDWVGFSEVDMYAKAIYQTHFQGSIDLGDIRTVDLMGLPKGIDIITFGFPCQDLSIAGKRQGISAARSGLFFEAIKIIKSSRPRYFIFENVKGLLSSNEGKDFETVLQTIADIGYDGEWQCLNTAWFLPQNRERIYFVGFPRGQRRPQVFPVGEITDLPQAEARREQKTQPRVSSTIDARYGALRNSGETYIQVGALKKLNDAKTQGYRVFDPSGVASTLTGNSGGLGAKTGLYMLTEKRTDKGKQIRRDMQSQGKDWSPRREKELVPRSDNLSNCITATPSKEHFLSDGCKIRRLTPLECERLQGFPEGWTIGQSDTQRYKCLGNAVSVPVVEHIASKLITEIQHG